MGGNNLDTYDRMTEKFVEWAKASNNVKAIFIIGSRARGEQPADEYSDLDLIVVASDPEYFLVSDQWLDEMGAYWLSFSEDTVGGGKERRVLFENALDTDFLIYSEDLFRRNIKELEELFVRGSRVLLDKTGLADVLPRIPDGKAVFSPPAERDFLNCVNDFWYHSVWSAKKILRGELWMAKSCVDSYMKGHLLRVIEWHAHATNGWDYDTWHSGRFLDIWAEPAVRKELRGAFARYDLKDTKNALLATMTLFHRLAAETAEKLGFCYPYDADESSTNWVGKALADLV